MRTAARAALAPGFHIAAAARLARRLISHAALVCGPLLSAPAWPDAAIWLSDDPALADPDWHIPLRSPADNAAHPQYELLARALAEHQAMERSGGWPEVPWGPDLRFGDRDERVAALRNRLRASGDYRAEMLADPWFFDAGLDQALRHFQHRHGLPQTGVLDERSLDLISRPLAQRIGQLNATLERWRWLPSALPPRYVWVNTAASTVELFENGQSVLAMRTIVGHPSRPTPSLVSAVRQVVFNPTWSVPHTIAVEDLLPRQQEDPGYLARHGFRVFRGYDEPLRAIDPAAIDWSGLGPKRFPYWLRQDSGPANALGRIKLVMDNPFDIYLHDTPERGLFALTSRTLGSGCVRLEDARAFTSRLLAGDRPWSVTDTDQRIAMGRLNTLNLHVPVPIFIVYLTAWVSEDGTVHFRRDSYGRDARLLAAL